MLKEIWAIRIRLQLAGRLRDLALFNLAIDSKLRGCGLVSTLNLLQLFFLHHHAPSSLSGQQESFAKALRRVRLRLGKRSMVCRCSYMLGAEKVPGAGVRCSPSTAYRIYASLVGIIESLDEVPPVCSEFQRYSDSPLIYDEFGRAN